MSGNRITEDDGEEWEIISIYKRDNGIEDGIIFNAGKIANREIDLTTNLIAKLDKYKLVTAIVKGLEIARHFRQPDMKEIEVNGKKVWVDDNRKVITLMLPEDY